MKTSRLRIVRSLVKWSMLLLGVLLVFVIALVYFGWSSFALKLPALRPWHTQAPASEFQASDEKADYKFDDYLKQEERIFSELAEFVNGPWASEVGGEFSRFGVKSVSNPATMFERNWNRSFVHEVEKPKAGVMFLHGLSDSPYSFRALSEKFHSEGYTTIGLRVPGHGTCPAALAEVTDDDWRAAVRVAAKGLRSKLPPDAPMIIVGFSNGGALAVDYALSAVDDSELPRPKALILISPMIGITGLAEVTRFHKLIAAVSGDPKANWSGVDAEIDPFKYASWPMNASVQGWKMTQRVEKGLASLAKANRMNEFPPVLTYQSAVDATVVVSKLMNSLYNRVAKNGSELVLFDINRSSWLHSLLDLKFEKAFLPAFEDKNLAYKLSQVTNTSPSSPEVHHVARDGAKLLDDPLDLKWPRDNFSLSHFALPFPENDPVYGALGDTSKPKLPLGHLNLRGESGVLKISDALLLRLRHNPFYPLLEFHSMTWLDQQLAAKK
jgi:alpha-beta hydrolase superfamily lysophospholipase